MIYCRYGFIPFVFSCSTKHLPLMLIHKKFIEIRLNTFVLWFAIQCPVKSEDPKHSFRQRQAICPCIFLCRNLGQNCYLNLLSPCIPVGTKASFLLMELEQGYIAVNIERIIFRNRLKVLT